jgi:2-(1,2-epoxy-1,2-dihydrophenyl)acetyl-CoA isomerase
MNQVVEFCRRESIAYITLNRPKSFNSLDGQLAEELCAAVSSCFDPEIRAVVITGAGRAFCAGGDLDYMKSAPVFSDALAKLTFYLNRIVTDIRLLPKPVIAAVNGVAAGAGMSIALACDLRIASSSAKFKQAYTSSGLVPDGGWTTWVPSIIGLAKASELIFLDQVITASDAERLGLVSFVVSDEEFTSRVEKEARNLAKGATKAFGEAKMLLNQSILSALESQLERERQAMIRIGYTEDVKEGVQAFFQKRLPDFSGK